MLPWRTEPVLLPAVAMNVVAPEALCKWAGDHCSLFSPVDYGTINISTRAAPMMSRNGSPRKQSDY